MFLQGKNILLMLDLLFVFTYFGILTFLNLIQTGFCPVGCGQKICQLHFCRGVRACNEGPEYDSKPFDGEAPVREPFNDTTLRSHL